MQKEKILRRQENQIKTFLPLPLIQWRKNIIIIMKSCVVIDVDWKSRQKEKYFHSRHELFINANTLFFIYIFTFRYISIWFSQLQSKNVDLYSVYTHSEMKRCV